MAESRGASIIETPYLLGDERYIEIDGEKYLRASVECTEYIYKETGEKAQPTVLSTAQEDLRKAWHNYIQTNSLHVPLHLKFATGDCPEHVRNMLQEIIEKG